MSVERKFKCPKCQELFTIRDRKVEGLEQLVSSLRYQLLNKNKKEDKVEMPDFLKDLFGG